MVLAFVWGSPEWCITIEASIDPASWEIIESRLHWQGYQSAADWLYRKEPIAAVAVTADSGLLSTLRLVDADCVSRLLCGLQSTFLKHTYRILRLYVLSSTEQAVLTECFTADIIAGIIWAIALTFLC